MNSILLSGTGVAASGMPGGIVSTPMETLPAALNPVSSATIHRHCMQLMPMGLEHSRSRCARLTRSGNILLRVYVGLSGFLGEKDASKDIYDTVIAIAIAICNFVLIVLGVSIVLC